MYNKSRRFRRYAARVAARYSPRDYDIITSAGHWESSPAGKRGRRWVTGYCRRYAFEAVIYPRHAQEPDAELEDTYIRKLCLRRMADQRIVAVFDRGWKVFPRTEWVRSVVGYFATAAFVEYRRAAMQRGEEPVLLDYPSRFLEKWSTLGPKAGRRRQTTLRAPRSGTSRPAATRPGPAREQTSIRGTATSFQGGLHHDNKGKRKTNR
jgi:hypothetical protein